MPRINFLFDTGKMKAAFSLLCLIATMNFAFAFFGPLYESVALVTGTNGTYQAVATGVNLSGVFSFVIKDGLQTSDQNAVINGWVFFVDGNIISRLGNGCDHHIACAWHSQWRSDNAAV